MARIMARILIIIASVKNCCRNLFLVAPFVFLTPTSLALMEALAVVRFIKLMQPTTSIRNATIEKILM